MPGCSLSIELDRPDRTFRPGEVIRGRVRVHTVEACRCDRLALVCEWRTHGKGNTVTGEHASRDLGSADWQVGEEYEYRFELPAPVGPLTYRGHLFNVDWYLLARADVPWAFDPKTEGDFLLRPWTADDVVAGTGGYRHGGPKMIEAYSFGPLVRTVPTPAVPGHGLRLGLGCVGVGVLALCASALWGWVLFLLSALLTLGGGSIVYLERRRASVYRALGNPRARLRPTEAHPGDAVEASIEVSPPEDLRVFSARAELTGREVVESGSGSSRTTHEHALASAVEELWPAETLLPPGRRSLRAKFRIPIDASPTFTATDNEVRWTIRVHVSSEAAADWEAELPLLIRPPSARAALPELRE